MTDNRLGYIHTRVYTRINGDHEETVYVNVDANGYIRMSAGNLDQVLTHLGYTEIRQKANA